MTHPLDRECEAKEGFLRLNDVPDIFVPYVDSALTRLTYLHEGIGFIFEDGFIWAKAAGEIESVELKSDIAHALYREKIFQESMPMRKSVYAKIFGQ